MRDDSAHAGDCGALVLSSSSGIKESQTHTCLKKTVIFATCTVCKLGLVKPVGVNSGRAI